MNERQRNLLRVLLVNSDKVFQIEVLRAILKCSEKTVRNDLNKIEEFLKSYKEAELIRKPGIGIILQASESTQAEIFQDLYQVNVKTKEERVIEIAYHLLISSKPFTLKESAEKYFTNPADIKRDLEKIEEWLSRFNLKVTTKQRLGSIVEGDEFYKRNAIAHLSELVSSYSQRNYVLDFFLESEINAVRKVIQDTQLQYRLDLTDGGFESLVIHALIMIKRTRQNTPVIVSKDDVERTLNTKEYEVTTYLLNKLEEILKLSFPENERIYYSWHIASSIQNTEVMESSISMRPSNGLAEQAVNEMIKQVHYLTSMPFENDLRLKDGLIIHMDAVIKRISYGFHITNPMLDDIKKLYPYLFSMVVFAVNDLNKQYNVLIPEEEAAYLVLHFQASIERMEQERAPKQALVVCHMGIGMSRLLQAKLEQQYSGIEIIDCIAKNELGSYLNHHDSVDFIISTVPLTNQVIPQVVISPLLDSSDKKKLNHFIQNKKQDTKITNYPTLHHFMNEGLFQKNIDLEHPFEIVERLANQLVRLAVVDESFTHNVLLRERTSSTSIGGKIAIPHAQPETVKKSTLSVAILKKPTEWGSEMVSIVFLLAISVEDRQLTQDLLKEISNLSQEPTLVEKMINADSKEEVIDLFS
ncbi:BglG family transcription antiterminator [Virgibacillus sp. MSJ-26]|uniref:BglG family transcription antiterminator n=1 Tax=Virgibacillus sp. MSJ-26 TaxID=2841522 RepID=UPI001C0FB04A|nr:BglG family transcription antiterminator [Virgibacillus sp. MSJ-26]MBU5468326.1 BglG family transcription antiterminator [Virgibacillus sp. MSJ-26]